MWCVWRLETINPITASREIIKANWASVQLRTIMPLIVAEISGNLTQDIMSFPSDANPYLQG